MIQEHGPSRQVKQRMGLSGILVVVSPAHLEDVVAALNGLAGVDVHHRDGMHTASSFDPTEASPPVYRSLEV